MHHPTRLSHCDAFLLNKIKNNRERLLADANKLNDKETVTSLYKKMGLEIHSDENIYPADP